MLLLLADLWVDFSQTCAASTKTPVVPTQSRLGLLDSLPLESHSDWLELTLLWLRPTRVDFDRTGLNFRQLALAKLGPGRTCSTKCELRNFKIGEFPKRRALGRF